MPKALKAETAMHLSTPTDEQEIQAYSYIKIIQSGTKIETYEYEKQPPEYRKPRKRQRIEKSKKRRATNVARARNNFARVVRSSLVLGAPAFITLTMVGICDIAEAYGHFTAFTERARRAYGKHLAWVAVPEFQKRGAVHFHCLIWGLKDATIERERSSRDIQALWARGWLDILKSDGSPKIAGYMAKYMSKAMYDDRLMGKKSYTVSRNALRPKFYRVRTSLAQAKETPRERYRRIKALVPVDKATGHADYERVYYTEWLGRCRQRTYNLS